MDPATLVASALGSERGRAALLAGDTGGLIRLVREGFGLRQADLGHRTGFSQSTISRLEQGRGRISDIEVLAAIAETLHIPPSVLGLAQAGSPGRDQSGTTRAQMQNQGASVDRSQFLRGLLGAAVSLALPPALTDTETGQVGASAVRACRAALGRLYDLDYRHGGAHVYALSTVMIERMHHLLAHARYTTAVGRDLRALTAAVTEHAGWLAYDAGRDAEARQWWLESLHTADLAGDRNARVTTLASMSLQATDRRRGREVIELVSAARRTAGKTATPRLLSLLAAREALGHATLGDRTATTKAVCSARRWLDLGATAEDPAWLSFWNAADLACHETRIAVLLDDSRCAQAAARAALATAESSSYPRNHALYAVRLANILVRAGSIEEAINLVRPVVARDSEFGSWRITAEIRSTVSLLGQHKTYRPAREFVDWSGRLLPPAGAA